MRASLKFITDSYRQFNRECFAGTLPEVELHVSSSRRALGCLKFRRIRDGRGWRYADFSIWISNRLDLPQEVIEDTIIHEMIHLYIHVNGLRDTSAHGKVFRTMMDAVNSRHERRVTVSHRSSAEENASDRAVRDHYICLRRAVRHVMCPFADFRHTPATLRRRQCGKFRMAIQPESGFQYLPAKPCAETLPYSPRAGRCAERIPALFMRWAHTPVCQSSMMKGAQ